MKLSILIWNNKISHLERLLLSIFNDYNSRDTEVIIIDEGKIKIDTIFDKFDSKITEGSLKIIFTDNDLPTKAYCAAASVAKGDYIIFLESASEIKNKQLEKLMISLEVLKPDILETEIKFIGDLTLNYRISEQLKRNVIYDATNTSKLYAYISPFLNNKIIRTSFFNDVIKLPGSSPDEITLSYRLLKNAKTYLFTENPKFFLETKKKINIVDRMIQWEFTIRFLERYGNWNSIEKYVEYAYIKYLYVIMKSVMNAEKLTEEQYRIKLTVQERVYRLFPNWKNNELLYGDNEIMYSGFFKDPDETKWEQTMEKGLLRPEEKKLNPFIKFFIKIGFIIRKAFGWIFKIWK